MQKHSFAEGDSIFEIGDNAERLFLVISGTVEVSRDNFSSHMQKGKIFGEAALLSRKRSLSAVAMTECELLSMTREGMIEAFSKNPDQAVEIIDALFAKLANTTDELITLRLVERGSSPPI